MKYFILLLLPLLPGGIKCQQLITLKSASKKLISQYEKAQVLYQHDEFEKAETAFLKILKKYPNFINANIKLASLYFETNKFSKSEEYFNYAIQLDSLFDSKIYYTLALANYSNLHFNQAKTNMQQFLTMNDKYPQLQGKASQYLKTFIFADSCAQHPLAYELQSASFLNSPLSEYLPSITSDGNKIIFTRRINNVNEDLYMTVRTGDTWSTPVSIENLNTAYNEGSPNLSSDGKKLIFSSCDRKSSFGGCDLYLSNWETDHWSAAINMGDVINSPAYESNPCFANHDTQIYFSSNRIGTLGGLDIFITERQTDNTWSKPKNIGPQINTTGNEDCPFVYADNKTLFFSSNGHIGMGGKDLFVSHRKSITEKWNSPSNLGYPINSIGDDASLIVDHTGHTAYIASDKASYLDYNGTKNIDIYTFELPQSLRPTASAFVSLTILDKQNNNPIEASIKIFDLNNNELFYTGHSDHQGKVTCTLPTNVNFAIHITHKDYVFEPHQIEKIDNDLDGKSITKFIYLQKKISPPSAIILKNVLFETNSALLKKESDFDLQQIYLWLIENPSIRIKITGHTDNVGNESDNLKLSLDRASAVRQYLLNKGIQLQRIEAEGKGESQPIDSNETEIGRKNNRRTEFIIL